jgi:hypothetical protein
MKEIFFILDKKWVFETKQYKKHILLFFLLPHPTHWDKKIQILQN